MEESFINKVFDAYLKSDYSYGDDNLNPKREIKKDTRVDTEDELDKILAKVHSKIQSIGKKYKDPEKKKENVSINLNNDGKNIKGRKALNLIPSEDDFDTNSDDTNFAQDGIESALLEIENLIPKILVALYPAKPIPGNLSSSNDLVSSDESSGRNSGNNKDGINKSSNNNILSNSSSINSSFSDSPPPIIITDGNNNPVIIGDNPPGTIPQKKPIIIGDSQAGLGSSQIGVDPSQIGSSNQKNPIIIGDSPITGVIQNPDIITGGSNPIGDIPPLGIPPISTEKDNLIGVTPYEEPSITVPSPIIIGFEPPELYKINCYGTIDFISDEDPSNDDKGNSDDNEDNEDEKNKENPDNPNKDSMGDISNNNNSMDLLAENRDKFLQEAINNINRNNASTRECALADLKVLKMISSVLKTLRGLKNFIDSTVNPAMEICQIVVLAAQCWNNPTCVGEILNRLLQKIQSILIMVASKLLQLLWDLLGMDCVTSQVQSVVIEIKSALAGISSIFSEVDKTAISIGNSFDKLGDAFDEVEDSFKSMLNYSVSDRLRDQFDLDEFAKNAGNFNSNFRSGLQQEVESSEAYRDIMDTVDMIKGLGKSKKKMVDNYMKTTSKDGEVNKFVSRFKNIKSK